MAYVCLEMIMGFVTFILKDPNYYNADPKQLPA